MDTQHFPLMYPPTATSQSHLVHQVHQINASIHEPSWHPNHHSPASSSSPPAQSSQMFSVVTRNPDLDYPSPAASTASPSYLQHHLPENYPGHHQSPGLDCDQSNGTMVPGFNQVESSIGPNRVLTRRQRAALVQGALGRRTSSQPNFQRTDQESSPRHHSTMYLAPSVVMQSRPQTPNNAPESNHYPTQRDRLSLNIASAIPIQMQSPRYPLTPASSSSPYSPYSYYGGHSRSNSTSNSTNPRSASPALSVASALTSVSSSTSAPNSSTFATFPRPSSSSMSPLAAPRPKQRKQRLFNVDRKAICLYHKQFPNARQEDIAIRYGVERSTISKILKHKTKWLNVPEHEGMRIAKHRPSKFPEIEEELVKWLAECTQTKTILSDALIRSKAKETARELHIPDEKFKASSGWVENFKHRHGIRGGIWQGDGKNTNAARALGSGGLDDVGDDALSPLNPAFDGHADLLDDAASVPPPSNFGGDVDPNAESEGSPDSETEHQGNEEELETESMALQPAWPEPNNIELSSNHSLNQSDLSAPASMHENMSHSPHIQHHQQTESNTLLEHIHLPSHQHVPEPEHAAHIHHEAPAVYDAAALAIYQPVPPIPSNAPPTLADAEEAINKLIIFLDTSGEGIINYDERQSLNHIKCALFQAASGVPYDRGQR